MTIASIRYSSAAASDVGKVRSSNEDAYGLSIESGVYVVCDGMGGAAAGEVASAMALEQVMRLLCNRNDGVMADNAKLEECIQQAVCSANEIIYSHAEHDRQLSGMGTTLVGLVAADQHIVVFNVGDSRCYRLRNSKLEQITLDHSFVQDQVSMGLMSADEARRSPMRNMITRALGSPGMVEPDLFSLQVELGDLFLLCSDGLTGELSDRLIQSLLGKKLPLEVHCMQLVEAANHAGGRDNITCLLVRAENHNTTK